MMMLNYCLLTPLEKQLRLINPGDLRDAQGNIRLKNEPPQICGGFLFTPIGLF
jgi:hypothetical protein